MIHDDLHRGVVTLLVRNANFRDTARIMQRARSSEAEHLTPLGAKADFGGDLAVSLHFLERWRLAEMQAPGDPAAVARAARESSPAIVADAAAVALGFGLLSLSQVPANARLGLVIASALVAAALLTRVGLTAALVAGAAPFRRAEAAPRAASASSGPGSGRGARG